MSYSMFLESAVTGGEFRLRATSPRVRTGKRLVIVAHGYSATESGAGEWDNVYGTSPEAARLVTRLAGEGFLVYGPDLANGLFGANPTPARVNEEWQHAVTNYGAAPDKVIIVGSSMGFLTAHHFARLFPGKLAGIYGIQPGVDLTDIYTNNRAGVQAAVGAAWGVAFPTPLPGVADPSLNPSVWQGVSGRLAYSTADGVVIPAGVIAFAAASGMTSLAVSQTVNHGDTLVASVPFTDLTAFLYANGA